MHSINLYGRYALSYKTFVTFFLLKTQQMKVVSSDRYMYSLGEKVLLA